jgi:hypothetical protein
MEQEPKLEAWIAMSESDVLLFCFLADLREVVDMVGLGPMVDIEHKPKLIILFQLELRNEIFKAS